LINAATSRPVRPFTAAPASATVRVVFFTISEAPSDERTVSESMFPIGSAAARTMSGSMLRTVWMTAASLNCLYASARRASAFAAASP